jgi:MFS superfamily sulfate permease-like transporter
MWPFLNKALLRRILNEIDENSSVIIDASKAKFIDFDIQETLDDFLKTAPDDNIIVEVFGLPTDQRLKSRSLTIPPILHKKLVESRFTQ